MNPRFSNQEIHALTLMEVLVVIVILALIVAILLPVLATARRKSSRIECVDNLKKIGLSYRVWEGDHGGKFPMFVSVTNGGAMELVATGNIQACFDTMSNELSTPKILHCPQDLAHIEAGSFSGLAGSNISYFIGMDVTNAAAPQAILCGDDNFTVNGILIKSGLQELSANDPISWTATRHKHAGNIAIANGSVQQLTQTGLRDAFRRTGLATNHLAIP